MRKKIIILSLVICMALLLGESSYAAERRSGIKSKGSISFEEGRVFITARDLEYLAGELDDLEKHYKISTINALSSVGTFFRKDGTTVYDRNANELAADGDKTALGFRQIEQGILMSQSITSVEGLQAHDKDGNPLYYSNEEESNAKNHLQTGTGETEYPLYYKAALEDNLSAGCAAWVNGQLIKGNGADNKHFHEIGFQEGYAQGLASALDKVTIQYTYHKHKGNEQNVGGCYGMRQGTRQVRCGCKSYSFAEDQYGTSTCGNCGHNHGEAQCDHVTGEELYDYIGLTCGKTTRSIESATIVY